MENKILRPWFVSDNLPRHEDWKNNLDIKNASHLKSEIEQRNKFHDGVRMYLGNYEIGQVLLVSNDFIIEPTQKSGNGIFAVLNWIFEMEMVITMPKMDEIIEKGISLEAFVKIISDDDKQIAITDDPATCNEKIHSGYLHVITLNDAIHEDFRKSVDDKSVILVLFNGNEVHNVEECDIPQVPRSKHRLWFVNEASEWHGDFKKRLEISSIKQLRTTIKEFERFPDTECLRMYLGEYEIGSVGDDNLEECIFVGGTLHERFVNIGERLIRLFGMYLEIPYEKMDYMLGKEFSLEEFIEFSMTSNGYEVEITDAKERIWELLHSGYTTLCRVKDLLHVDIKDNHTHMQRYCKDKRVILIKMNMDKAFYEEQFP